MKKTLVHFFNTPKSVTIASFVIAIPVAIIGYFFIHNSPLYKNINSISVGNILNNGISANDLTLGFVSGGRISSVNVKVGDVVKKNDILATLDSGNAMGVLSQARAAYESAQANYQKVVNGATGSTIDVAKTALNTAKTNLDQATKQQNVLVDNAHRALLNSSIIAQSVSDNNTLIAPIITGVYSKTDEGNINISVYATMNRGYFSLSGITIGTGQLRTSFPEPISDTGLYIQFPTTGNYSGTSWVIKIPNNNASNYLANYNAYQLALQTKNQTLSSLQSAVDQANSNLTQIVTTARPEDIVVAEAQVENTKGALMIAQAAYDNTVIKAPNDGKIITVSIVPGQIAAPSVPAIEILTSN